MAKKSFKEWIDEQVKRAVSFYNYCCEGVWNDTRSNWKVRTIKTLNLSVRSFFDSDVQSQACTLTYLTLLSVVPALAMIFAIGRGFGLQDLIVEQLFKLFPSQQTALESAIQFVDSYLAQASEGLFVGIGIVFLLWALISLLSNVEKSFNSIWRVKSERSLWRKATDYLAIFIILPVLMICAAGLSILMSNTIRALLPFEFMGPAITFLLDLAGWVFTWLFFTGAYMLIPNARVKFVNAFISGVIVGTGFQILQWVFLSGQIYVAKYNAIYGSVSFLPLLLIWLQLVWLITLTGALLCYASQNVGRFSFNNDIRKISRNYKLKVEVVLMAVIAKRFEGEEQPLTCSEIAQLCHLPVQLVTDLANELREVGLISFIDSAENIENPLQPAVDISRLTVGDVAKRCQERGSNNFIPSFDEHFCNVVELTDDMSKAMIDAGNSTLVKSLKIEIK